MSEELNELQEHAEHAKHDPSLAPVSLTMAVLAVLVAVVSLTGHRAHTEEVVLQAKASDQWAFYQAKNIRRHTDELFTDLTSIQARQIFKRSRALQGRSERNRRQGPRVGSRSRHRTKPGRPLRFGRGVSGNRISDYIDHTALRTKNFLVLGSLVRSGRNGRRGHGVHRALTIRTSFRASHPARRFHLCAQRSRSRHFPQLASRPEMGRSPAHPYGYA